MADSFYVSPDGVRINISHLGPKQIAQVKAMNSGAKAAALAQTLTKTNAQNAANKASGFGGSGAPGNLAKAQAAGLGISDPTTSTAPTLENGMPITAPTFGDNSQIQSLVSGIQNPITPSTGVSSPVDSVVKLDKAINNKTGALDTNTATTNAERLAADAAVRNFNLNNPNSQTDVSGNTRRTVLNPDGTTSIVDTAGQLGSAAHSAFLNSLNAVQRNGALDLSGAPQIDATGQGREKAQDAVYNYITKNYASQKAQEMEDKKQELANRGIPLDPSPNGLYGRELKAIDDKYQSLDDQAKNQALTQGNQYFATNVGAQSAAHDAFTGDATTQFQGNVGAAATLGGVSNATNPNFTPFAGSQFNDQSGNYVNLTNMDIGQIMQKYGIDEAAANALKIAQINARKSGSSGSSGSGVTFGGDAPIG